MTTDLAVRDPIAETITQLRSERFAQQLEGALPGNVTVARFTQVAATAIQTNPDIALVHDRGTLFRSIVRCAQDGLLPDGREAALVIFRVKGAEVVQYLPMIGGLRKIAAKSDLSLSAYVVYQADTFDYELGEAPHVTHKPPPLDHDRGQPIGAYAVATDKRGQRYLEVMSATEIEKVRAVSRASNSEYGPWVKWWPEMARKTVARRLFKQLPLGDLDERSDRILGAEDFAYNRDGPLDPEEAAIAVSVGPAFQPPTETSVGEDDTQPTGDSEPSSPATPEIEGEATELFPIPEGVKRRHEDHG